MQKKKAPREFTAARRTRLAAAGIALRKRPSAHLRELARASHSRSFRCITLWLGQKIRSEDLVREGEAARGWLIGAGYLRADRGLKQRRYRNDAPTRDRRNVSRPPECLVPPLRARTIFPLSLDADVQFRILRVLLCLLRPARPLSSCILFLFFACLGD